MLDTLAIENFISVKETDGPKLSAGLEQHVREYDVDIMNLQRAEALVPGANGLTEVRLASGATLKSKSVIISTGARWREMNVPGEKEYRGRGVAYCPHCDGPLFKGKRVAVIGGGNSGVEAAIDLAGVVAHVTLLEFDKALRADAVLLTEVYAAGEAQIVAADGRSLARALRVAGRVEPVFIDDVASLPRAIAELAQSGDVVLCMGAGSIGNVPARTVELLQKNELPTKET